MYKAWSLYQVSESKRVCATSVFSFIILLQLRLPPEPKFLCMLGYTKWEYPVFENTKGRWINALNLRYRIVIRWSLKRHSATNDSLSDGLGNIHKPVAWLACPIFLGGKENPCYKLGKQFCIMIQSQILPFWWTIDLQIVKLMFFFGGTGHYW